MSNNDTLGRMETGRERYLFSTFSFILPVSKGVARNVVTKHENAIPYNLSIGNKVKLTLPFFKLIKMILYLSILRLDMNEKFFHVTRVIK